MKKVKKISKYILNAMNMLNALIVGLAEIWNWNIDKLSATLVVVTAIISAYLVGGKLFSLKGDNE